LFGRRPFWSKKKKGKSEFIIEISPIAAFCAYMANYQKSMNTVIFLRRFSEEYTILISHFTVLYKKDRIPGY
jgi:hypothetical protein